MNRFSLQKIFSNFAPNPFSESTRLDLFLLLDLIGAQEPTFRNVIDPATGKKWNNKALDRHPIFYVFIGNIIDLDLQLEKL